MKEKTQKLNVTTQIVTKLQNSNYDKTQIMTKLKNSNCDNSKYDKSQFMKKTTLKGSISNNIVTP